MVQKLTDNLVQRMSFVALDTKLQAAKVLRLRLDIPLPLTLFSSRLRSG
jgi:hypothetical protein